jgi:carboxylate-amine ligase
MAAEQVTAPAEFSFGIEEEYFLVDAQSGEVAFDTPEQLFADAFAASGGRTGHEFLRTQIEAATKPCTTAEQARAELVLMRRAVVEASAGHGLAIMAAGTHPTAPWWHSLQSGKQRYDRVMAELQMIGRRTMLCGMHVHVQLPDSNRRVDVMNRMQPYLPLLLALSTSSPFWQGRATGLKSYRFAAYDELPRSGIPELFPSAEAYDAYVAALVRAGAIPDATYIWWAIRPSGRYPTLELRAPDCCTRVEDALAIAALYRVLARHLYVDADCNAGMDAVARALVQENKWRAQRHGLDGTFVTQDGVVRVADFLEDVIALAAEDARALCCVAEIEHCRAIAAEGTSADRQLALYAEHEPGEGAEAALDHAIRWLVETTCRLDPVPS